MQYLKVKNLSKSFGHKPLFDAIDFSIDKWEKVALVAKNGAGKSTLLKVLIWEIDRTDGEINRGKNIHREFLPQENRLDPEAIVADILFDNDNPLAQLIKKYERLVQDPNVDTEILSKIIEEIEEKHARNYETKIKTIISKLQINRYLDQKVSSLSGGEAKRVALARVLVNEPDFLILDEPTNHLDLEMIEWLEKYFATQHITLLMVTHDRYFLERVCWTIWELERWKLHKYPGNYSYFLEKKAQREEYEDLYMKKLRKIHKQELARIRKAPQGRWSKSVYRENKFYEIEHYYDTNKAILQAERRPLQISMEGRRLGTKICKIHNLYKSFVDKKIVEGFSYEFKKNEHIGIIGKNWVWKSTFIRMLLWKEIRDSGKITRGKTVQFGYYQQKDIQFKANQKVIDVIRNISEYMYIGKNQKISASKALENFLFPVAQQHMLAESLSGGEKRRLYLLSVLIQNPNFLILDEPTNDLDLLTLWVLEEFLLQYQGCLIIISHDRFFIDKIVDHLFIFKWEWKIETFLGTYSAYQKSKKLKMQKNKQGDKLKKWKQWEKADHTIHQKKKLSYHEKREFENIEEHLEKLEKRKQEINKLFDSTDLWYNEITELSKELGQILQSIEKYEARRMELSEWI